MSIFTNQSVHHHICEASFARDGLRKWSNLIASDSIPLVEIFDITEASNSEFNSQSSMGSDFSATQNQCIELNVMTVSNCSCLSFWARHVLFCHARLQQIIPGWHQSHHVSMVQPSLSVFSDLAHWRLSNSEPGHCLWVRSLRATVPITLAYYL